jgi:phage baseplate assembly protein W
MVRTVQQIDPLDLRDSIGVGVNLPFTGPAVFNTTFTSREATKANLINYFLTSKGERYFNPGFGSDIRSLLFDNISETKLENIKAVIEEELQFYFPRVRTKTFEISSDPDYNTVRVYVVYSIVNTNVQDEILIDIQV